MSELSPPETDDVFRRFQRVLVEVLDVSPAQLQMETRFVEDLDQDSLALVEAVMAMEDEFGISVAEEELANIETVRQAFVVLQRNL